MSRFFCDTPRRGMAPSDFSSEPDPISRSTSPTWHEREALDNRCREYLNIGKRTRKDLFFAPLSRYDRMLAGLNDRREPTNRASSPPLRRRGSHAMPQEPVERPPFPIFTMHGVNQTEEAIKSSPFYSRIEIPAGARHVLTRSTRPGRTYIVLHAVHPIPRRYLREVMGFSFSGGDLRFVGEHVDESLYAMTEMDELAEHMLETLHRINELLTQDGQDIVGYPCGHRERIMSKRMEVEKSTEDAETLAEEEVGEEA